MISYHLGFMYVTNFPIHVLGEWRDAQADQQHAVSDICSSYCGTLPLMTVGNV